MAETEKRKSWLVTWHGEPFEVSKEEYLELRTLAHKNPRLANEKAREYYLRQQKKPVKPEGDDPRAGHEIPGLFSNKRPTSLWAFWRRR